MTELYSETLRGLFIAALKGRTLAGQRVFAPRDWPVQAKEMPAILVDDQREQSESRGNAGFPAFHTIAFLVVDGRVEQDTEEKAKADLSTLRAQIKAAILTSHEIIVGVEQIVAIRTEARVSAETKKHVGELRMEFAVRYPEDFEPVITDTLEGIDVHADLAGPFDPTGIYPDPAFPEAVQPAPRTSGPDGRDEGGISVNLT